MTNAKLSHHHGQKTHVVNKNPAKGRNGDEYAMTRVDRSRAYHLVEARIMLRPVEKMCESNVGNFDSRHRGENGLVSWAMMKDDFCG